MSKKIETYPSEEFFIHTGIDGLYHEWNISSKVLKGNSEIIKYYRSILGDIFPAYNKRRIRNKCEMIYSLLLKDNQDLKDIKVSSYIDKSNVIAGAISKFNFNDIKFFTENYSTIQDYNKANASVYKEIKQKYNMLPEWVISPKTLKLII